MKFRTTTKAIKDGSINIRYASYCEMYYLLKNHEPIAYTCGIYGWNYDVYNVYGLTICTGYRGMPGKRLDNISEYEKKARKIYDNYNVDYTKRQKAAEKLLKEFCLKNGGII